MVEGVEVPPAVVTVPNLISLLRVATIPAFVALIVDRDTTTAGLLLFAAVLATDWVDGAAARRLGQVSEIGKLLDPTADRLALGAGLLALAARGAFPWWAALLVIVRDAVLLAVGAALLVRLRHRIDVRYVGKAATFELMAGVALFAWGNLGMPLAPGALAVGWAAFVVGALESLVAAWAYAGDARRAIRTSVGRGPA
jgi:CDP-diacylglycerol--glycerol-3-phosphate 3-phosphatidyltransferase